MRHWLTALLCVAVTATQIVVAQELPLPPKPSPAQCGAVIDEERFDCHPEDNASEERCVERGCCWLPADPKMPWCFYTLQYRPYENNGSYSQRVYRSQFPNDWRFSTMELVSLPGGLVFNIRMTDPDKEHFTPPFPKLNIPPETQTNGNDHHIIYSMHEEGKMLTARRNNSNRLLITLETRNVILSDQFVQVTVSLEGKLYGMGEHRSGFPLSDDWQTYTLWNHDVGPRENTNLYGSHPFFLNIAPDGYCVGFYLHNINAMDIFVQPGPKVTFRSTGGVIELYNFFGPTPAEVVKQYTNLVGLPAMPPYWGLGFQLCRWGYGSTSATRTVWQRMRDAGIPFDVQWNDIDYMKSNTDFTIDPDNFADLPQLVADIHAAGMRYVPMLDPGVSGSEPDGTYPPYSDGVDMDVFIKDNDGKIFVGKVWNPVSTVFPDFTHPRALEYWQKQLQEFHDKVPYDAIWLDMNEPSNFFDGTDHGCPDSSLENPPFVPKVDGGKLQTKTLCMTAQHYAGRHYDIHNLHAISEANVTRIALENILKKRTFIISRASSPGLGRYSGHWAGDNYSDWPELKASITELLSFSLYGVPLMGSDICGFNNDASRELCNRWMQLGAFYPFSRNHNTIGAKDQDPASFDQEFTDSVKRALGFRYRYLPYLYTLFYRASVYGETVARPLFFEFPKDNKTLSLDSAFLWGSGLYIVPVLTEGATSVEAYLPAGRWWHLYDDLGYLDGEQTVQLAADFETINVLARGGTIFPTQVENVTTTLSRKNPFRFVAAPDVDGNASGSLFWDDGESLGTIENNQYGLVSMNLSISGKSFTTSIDQWNTSDIPMVDAVTIYGVDPSAGSFKVNGEDARSAFFPGPGVFVQWSGTPLNQPINLSWS